jgi:precorrin-2 dehydrogenase/sirohydrochlorin ferrochelatase
MSMSKPLYPIFLKLDEHKVLIVGGGPVAEQKLEGVLRSARDVTVVAPQVSERIARWAGEGRIQHIKDEYRSGMAEGYFLVIAATDSEAVNRAVFAEAQANGALANAVDDPDYCSFFAPAVVSRGDFQIAISTGGASPALAQRVRQELEVQYGPEYGPWTEWLGRTRETLRQVLPRSESRKQLIRTLALGQPAKTSDDPRMSGGEHGRCKTH